MTKRRDDHDRVPQRTARLRWVPLSKIRVSDIAQRGQNTARRNYIHSCFDPDLMTPPEVSYRDGHYYVVDGQHRIGACIDWLGDGWETQQIQCWVYAGFTEAQEADMFLRLNDTLSVGAFDKFRIAIEAGWEVETDIDRIVRANGLTIARSKVDGAIGAVGALRRVYDRGPGVLQRTLVILRDAYGNAGFDAAVINGIGMVCARYNGELQDDYAIKRLSGAHGGVNALLQRAEVLRKQTGNQRAVCVAAAAVEILNRGRGGHKLTAWWAAA